MNLFNRAKLVWATVFNTDPPSLTEQLDLADQQPAPMVPMEPYPEKPYTCKGTSEADKEFWRTGTI